MNEKKTPLYDCHLAHGGTIVPFAGYLLPVQYPAGIIAEHTAVRTAAGLFDVSHMGEVRFSGKDALKNLNYILTNDFTSLPAGRVRYSVMCNERGGCVDDLIVYRIDEETFWVVVNAANRGKDVARMKAHTFGDVTVEDLSARVAQLAVQGPRAGEILRRLAPESALPAGYYTFRENVPVGGMKCLVSQTGYTGEEGYEIYLSSDDAPAMWNLLLETGRDSGLIPCGLGARDTLRLEAAMPLYGHEMDENISPFETGLHFGVKMEKDDFLGKKALIERGEPAIRRVGLRMTGRGIARENQQVYAGDRPVGRTTSGTYAPFLKCAVAMALVEAGRAATGTQLDVDVRGRRVTAEVAALPFYKRNIFK
ncbi:MAG: glycine cleavage system aminomethyltransferase GcvT [Tannerella sp.]|jgi:aminomethyltransferase|nr:glycine cleavage system aminomethyltransferase GcvT [Tannerella sp.]